MKTYNYFYLLIFVFLISSCTVDRSDLESDSNNTSDTSDYNEPDSELILPDISDSLQYDASFVPQDTILIDGSPEKYVKTEIEEHVFFKDSLVFEESKLNKILKFPYEKNKLAIVTATSAEGNNCEECNTYLSLFLFEKSDVWKLTEKHLQFEDIATYGNIDFVRTADLDNVTNPIAGDINVKNPDGKAPYIFLNSAYVSGREYEAYSMIFCKISNKYKNTAVITTEYRNDLKKISPNKMLKWKGELTFVKKDKNHPDIVLDIAGEKKGRNFIDRKVYIFDEDMYILKN